MSIEKRYFVNIRINVLSGKNPEGWDKIYELDSTICGREFDDNSFTWGDCIELTEGFDSRGEAEEKEAEIVDWLTSNEIKIG